MKISVHVHDLSVGLDIFIVADFSVTKLIFKNIFRFFLLFKKGGLLQLKFGVVGVGVGVNIYLWAQ